MGLRPNTRYAFWAASWKISCMVPAPPGANTMPAVATASIPSSRMLFEKYFAICEANWLIGSPATTHVSGRVRGPRRGGCERVHGVIALRLGAVGEVRAEVGGFHDPEATTSDDQ